MVDASATPQAPATPPRVWLELLQARVQQVADRADARSLVIKGPFAAELGLRSRTTSMDVDVLVEPGRGDDCVAGMIALGWRLRPVDRCDDVFPQHSTSLYHPNWPIDVDVHHRFPGLDGEPVAVFEALWAERLRRPAAGIDVATTGPVGTTLVLAVNALRTPWSERSQGELADLVDRARAAVSPQAIMDMASATGALAASRPFLEMAFPDACPAKWPPPSRTWYLYSLNPESASHRLIALRHAPLRKWPTQLWRALIPSRTALAATNLAVLEAGPKQLLWIRFVRIIGACRKLPTILSGYREFRRRESGR